MESVAARDDALGRLGLAPNKALVEGTAFTDEETRIFERVKREIPVAAVEGFDAAWQDRIIRGLWTHNKGTEAERLEQTKEAFVKISTWRREGKIDSILTRNLRGLETVMEHIRMTAGGDDLYGHLIWVEQLVEVAALCSCDLTTEEIVLVRAQATEAMERLKVKNSQATGLTRYKQVYVLDLAPLALGPLVRRGDVRKLTGEIMGLGSQYYPEGMWKIFIINAPFIFRTVYAVISPFIHPVTKDKIKILGGPSKYLKEMERNGIPMSSVPTLIGGTHPGRNMLPEIQELVSDAFPEAAGPVEETASSEEPRLQTTWQPTTAVKDIPRPKPVRKSSPWLCCANASAVSNPQQVSRVAETNPSPRKDEEEHDLHPQSPAPEEPKEDEKKEPEDTKSPDVPGSRDRGLVVAVHQHRAVSSKSKYAILTSMFIFVFWFVVF
ncbi:hypothetical protein CTAYLR_009835 [Chrysophaeum taylorii]|uniref:CRAL-TRIO domain-containing protein n=1 Tax=Chrysophaeum taylorii TaxID=2483200 RepID=A0AAD7U7V9_9STRA|nr:hypothetical protein CTAYLR_009835 [Chrysophaeum taylorii]